MNKKIFRVVVYLLVWCLLPSCNDKEKYYERPDWLKGTTKQVLESKGNYSVFIKAMETCGYESMINGRGLSTVFAANDEAFNAYLQKEFGTESLEEIQADPEKLDDLKLLMGYHCLNFSFTFKDFLAFSQTTSGPEPEAGDGACYKYQTIAKEKPTVFFDPVEIRWVDVYNKYLPVMSTELFKTREVDGESNYKFFFPDVPWNTGKDWLYVANAALTQQPDNTDNGYLYYISDVVKPLENLYRVIEKEEDFSLYLDIYNRYTLTTYNSYLSEQYAAFGDSLFEVSHNTKPSRTYELPEIYNEKSYHDFPIKNYENNLKMTINMFLPQNDVLLSYLQTTFADYGFVDPQYDMDSLPEIGLYHVMKAHAYDKEEIVLPEELNNGIIGRYGEEFIVPMADLSTLPHAMCSNGVFYGVNKVFEPALLNSPAEPLYKLKKYSCANVVFNQESYTYAFVNPAATHTLFVESDESMLSSDKAWQPNFGASSVYGDEKIVSSGAAVNNGLVSRYANNQLVVGDVVDPATASPGKILYYSTKEAFRYICIDSNNLYDMMPQEPGSELPIIISQELPVNRGKFYEVDREFAQPTTSFKNCLTDGTYARFTKKLLDAGLAEVDKNGSLTFPWMMTRRMMVFAPTDTVVYQAERDTIRFVTADSIVTADTTIYIAADTITTMYRDLAPGELWKSKADSAAYAQYLMNYFVPCEDNGFTDYILPNLGNIQDLEAMNMATYETATNPTHLISWYGIRQLSYKNLSNGSTVHTDPAYRADFHKDGVVFKLIDYFSKD